MSQMNIQIWDIQRLKPYELNVKIHSDEQVTRIAKSIKEFGWTQPIVVDKDGVIIAGHGRRLAATKLGFDTVPVWVRDDLNEEQVRALRLADNRVAEGDIDTELFRRELETLNYDLSGIFDDKELDFGVLDLGEMNPSVFIDDVDQQVKKQKEATQAHIQEAAARQVSIAKALGIKTVSGADEIHIAQFMAEIINDYGDGSADPAQALVAFAKHYVGEEE